jgi:hypothetical protein
MREKMTIDAPVATSETGNEKEEFQITGAFFIDYAAFMHYCYGDLGWIDPPEGSMEEILLDLIDKKIEWEKEAERLDPIANEGETEELLKKIDIVRKMIEHYSKEQ